MSDFSDLRPVFHTALCIIPPESLWGPIEAIRRVHDKAFARWMPHINLCFPFYDEPNFGEIAAALRSSLSRLNPFKLSLSTFGHFDHSKNAVMWLKPLPSRPKALTELYSTITDTLPALAKSEPYRAHLTVGQFGKQQVSREESNFGRDWAPIEWNCVDICLIHREGKDGRFEIRERVRIGGGAEEEEEEGEDGKGIPTIPEDDQRRIVKEVECLSHWRALGGQTQKAEVEAEATETGLGLVGVQVELRVPVVGVGVADDGVLAQKVSGKHCVVVLDNSGSMAGAAIRCAKEAIVALLKNTKEGLGLTFSFITFDSNARVYEGFETESLERQVELVNGVRACASTNFAAAFEAVFKVCEDSVGEEISVIFLSDGQDNCSTEDGRKKIIGEGHGALAARKNTYLYHSVGFTSGHDARFLTEITRQGLTQGSFQYIKQSSEIMGAIDNVAELLGFRSMTCRLVVGAGDTDEIPNSSPGLEEIPLPEGVKVLRVFLTDEGESDEIVARVFTSNIFLPRGDLEQSLRLEVQDGELQYRLLLRPEEKPFESQNDAVRFFIAFVINRMMEAIAVVSGQGVERPVLEKLQADITALDKEFDAMIQTVFAIRNRMVKKELLSECQRVKGLVASFFSALADALTSKLSNEKIASLNSLAYKQVSKRGLKKKLDKRIAANMALFEKIDDIVDAEVAKIDFVQLKADHNEWAESLGTCMMSQCNWIECLEHNKDCLCLTMDVVRSEAAIADPAQTVVREILPTLISAESFLDCVEYSLGTHTDVTSVHAGFDTRKSGASVVKGVAREKITGCLPLFIHPLHWRVARQKLKPVMGWTCTLDPMGYAPSQIVAVPFLVLQRVAQDFDKGEFHKRMFALVLETCVEIYKENRRRIWENDVSGIWDQYRDDPLVRTVDRIPKNEIFLMQVLAAIKSGDLVVDKEVLNSFVRCMVEEEMRRKQPYEFVRMVTGPDQSVSDFHKFLFKLFNIDQSVHVLAHVDAFKKEYMDSRTSSFALAFQRLAAKTAEANPPPSEEEEGEAVASAPKVGILAQLGETPLAPAFNDSPLHPFAERVVSKFDKVFVDRVVPVVNSARFLADGMEPIRKIADVNLSNEQLLGLICQNLEGAKNATRREMVEDAKYLDPFLRPNDIIRRYMQLVIDSEKKRLSTEFVSSMSVDETGQKLHLVEVSTNLDEFAGLLHGIPARSPLYQKTLAIFSSKRTASFLDKLEVFVTGVRSGIHLFTDRKYGSYQFRCDVADLYGLFVCNYSPEFDCARFLKILENHTDEAFRKYVSMFANSKAVVKGVRLSTYGKSVPQRQRGLGGVPTYKICKEVTFIRSGGSPLLVVTNAEDYVDAPNFRNLTLLDEPSVPDRIGVAVDSILPFAVNADVPVIVNSRLMDFTEVFIASGAGPHYLLSIAPAELVRILEATGHSCEVVEVPLSRTKPE